MHRVGAALQDVLHDGRSRLDLPRVVLEVVASVLGLAYAAAFRVEAVDEDAEAAETERDAADWVVVVVGAEVGDGGERVGQVHGVADGVVAD
jgi:hypothetical protein